MDALTGTNYANVKMGRTVVKSVLLTAPEADYADIALFDYNETAADSKVRLSAPAMSTVQVFFDGLVFPSGLSVVPSTNALSYVIEYAE